MGYCSAKEGDRVGGKMSCTSAHLLYEGLSSRYVLTEEFPTILCFSGKLAITCRLLPLQVVDVVPRLPRGRLETISLRTSSFGLS